MNDWMLRLGAIWPWRRRIKPSTKPSSTIFAFERSTAPPVPREYVSLYAYLEHRYATTVVLTFEQMEALLGFALPGPAYMESDWWKAAVVPTQRHSAAWTVSRTHRNTEYHGKNRHVHASVTDAPRHGKRDGASI